MRADLLCCVQVKRSGREHRREASRSDRSVRLGVASLADYPLGTMGGKALLGALLLASLCLAQPRQLKQSLGDVRGPVKLAASWALTRSCPHLPC